MQRKRNYRKIEAKGMKDAKKNISEGLTPRITQDKTVNTISELSKASNGKHISDKRPRGILMESWFFR